MDTTVATNDWGLFNGFVASRNEVYQVYQLYQIYELYQVDPEMILGVIFFTKYTKFSFCQPKNKEA